jgi:hypothetical protein
MSADGVPIIDATPLEKSSQGIDDATHHIETNIIDDSVH